MLEALAKTVSKPRNIGRSSIALRKCSKASENLLEVHSHVSRYVAGRLPEGRDLSFSKEGPRLKGDSMEGLQEGFQGLPADSLVVPREMFRKGSRVLMLTKVARGIPRVKNRVLRLSVAVSEVSNAEVLSPTPREERGAPHNLRNYVRRRFLVDFHTLRCIHGRVSLSSCSDYVKLKTH